MGSAPNQGKTQGAAEAQRAADQGAQDPREGSYALLSWEDWREVVTMLLSIQSHLPVCHLRWDEHGFRLAYQYSREEHETVSGQLFAALERLRVIWGSGRAHYADLAAEPEHVVVERGDLARLREQMAAATADLEEQLKIEKEARGRTLIALRVEQEARCRAVGTRNEALAELNRLREQRNQAVAERDRLREQWGAMTHELEGAQDLVRRYREAAETKANQESEAAGTDAGGPVEG
jgi:hypothetical protein